MIYLLNDPKRPEWADYLFIESTYGNKLHPKEDVEEILTIIIKETIIKKESYYSKFCRRTITNINVYSYGNFIRKIKFQIFLFSLIAQWEIMF